MPSANDLIARTMPPKVWAHFLADLGSTQDGRALGTTGRIDLSSVPTQLPDKRYVHVAGLLARIVADVDSDGAPAADLAAERVLASFANFRWGALSGKIPLFEGGDIDARVARFLEVAVRNGVAFPVLDGDAGNASAADIFPDTFGLVIRFPHGGAARAGGARADGVIFRGLFQDLLGADAFRYDVLAEANAASIGAVAGVTLNSFARVTWYALLYADPYPILDAVPRLRYATTNDLDDEIMPIDSSTRAHAVEYIGARQREEDTEALTFASAGDLTLRHGAYTVQTARSMAQMSDMDQGRAAMSGLPIDAGGAVIDARYAPVTGHLPFAWSWPRSDRDHWPRAPLAYTLSSAGASRTSIRLLRSELHTWTDDQIATAARELGVPADRLSELRERVRTVQIDPNLVPRRIVIG